MIKIKNRKINLGIVLIIIGLIWILSNLNVVDIDLYNIGSKLISGIFDLWPLMLIIVGINIIFKKELLNTILWAGFIALLVFYSFFMSDNFIKNNNESLKEEIYTSEMKENIDRGRLDIDIGATKFYISSIEDNFIKLEHDGAYDYSFSRRGRTENLYIKNKKNIFRNGDRRNFDLALNRSIPWEFDMDMGAVSGELDLKNIILEKFDLDMGAGDLEITLGNRGDLTSIDIDAGASKIIFNIPQDVGLKLNLDGALNSTNLDELDLIKVDSGEYISENYNSARTKYEIEVDMGVGKFEINYY